jgi:hypothetical protein
MGSESPNVILYDVNGQEMSVSNGSAIPSGTSGLMVLGSDGTNSRFITLDSTGRTITVGAGTAGTPAGGVISIQGVVGGTVIPVSGTVTTSTADATSTGTLGSLNATVQLAVTGENGAGMQLATGTLIGTIVPEISLDGGSTWVGTFFDDPPTSNVVTSIVFGSSNSATTKSIVGTSGASHVRVRVSVYSSGSATCNLRASIMQDPSFLSGGAAGSALPPVIQQIGGSVTTSVPTYSNATLNALSLNTSGGLRVDGSAVTQPVSGTVTANAGTGNFTVVQGTASNLLAEVGGLGAAGSALVGNPVQVGGSDGTNTRTFATDASGRQIVIGAGTAGTANTGVVTIQGIASMTPVQVSQATAANLNATVVGTGTDNTTNSTAKLPALVAVANTSAPTYVSGNMVPLSTDTSGNLRITGTISASNPSVSTTGSAVPASATFIGGEVQAVQAGLTLGDLYPLSMTQTGLLRVDGSNVTQPVSGTVTANQGTANSLANAWTTELTDGTHGPVAVKAASTAPVAADPALVVTVSPNTPSLSVIASQTAEATAAWTSGTTLNSTVQVNVFGYSSVAITFNQGSTITGGVVTFEASDTSGGTNWYPVTVVNTNSASVPSNVYTLAQSANVAFQMNVAGFVLFRVRLSTVISGTGTVNVGIAASASASEWEQAVYLTDGTHGPAAVKAASTAAVAADPALVVALSPNSPNPGIADVTATGALGALNATVQITLAGETGVGFQLAAGTLIGTIVAEVSYDGGTTWNINTMFTAGNRVNSIVFASSNTATSGSILTPAGTGLARIRVSVYSSGTANVTLRASQIGNTITTYAGPTNATIQPPEAVQIAGWDGTNFRAPAVKAPSTAAVATDQALVVAISPNNSISIAGAADATASGALGALNATVQLAVTGDNFAGMQLAAGTLVGTIIPEISTDGATTWVSTYFKSPSTGAIVSSYVFGSSNTATTASIIGTGGASHVRVRVSAYTSGTANCSLRASEFNDPVQLYRGPTNVAAPPNAAQIAGVDVSGNLQVPQVAKILGQTVEQLSTASTITSPQAAPAGLFAEVTGYGTLRVSNEPSSLFNDHFATGSLDTTNNWASPITSGAGAAVTVSGGSLTLTASTTASAYALLSSNPTFQSSGIGFIILGFNVKMEAAAVTGQERFFGVGTAPGSPTPAAPLTNAIGFEQTTTGALQAVIYSAGSAIYTQALTRPNDGNYHRYAVVVRPDATFWYLDSLEIPVASTTFNSPATDILPMHIHIVNGASPSAAGTFIIDAVGVGDSAPESISINDGLYPFRKGTVKAGSTAALATDPAFVVAVSPNNNANVLGAQTTETTASWTSATSLNTTVAITTTGYSTVAITVNQGSTISGGALTFEVSDTAVGTNWYPAAVVSSFAQPPTSTYALVPSTNVAFQVNISGFVQFRVRLSTAITGTATVNVGLAANNNATLTQQEQFVLLTDGSHGPAAIKAASTAAVATDPALVVAISPNNSVTVSGTTAVTGQVATVSAQTNESTAAWTSATTLNTALSLNIDGYTSVGITLNQGTTITAGAVTFEVSDTVAGTNWYPATISSTGIAASASSYSLTASTNIAFQLNVAGFVQFRIRLSTAIVGTATVNVGIAASVSPSGSVQDQYVFISDGTNGPAAVKAASTIAATTDPSLVVSISPNSAYSKLQNSIYSLTVNSPMLENKMDHMILLLNDIRDLLMSNQSKPGSS